MGQSASGIECDLSGGKFGPFEKQLFVGDQTHSTVMRVLLEKVNGRYQGACFPFRQRLRLRQSCRCVSARTARSLSAAPIAAGARGPKSFAIERLVWTGKVPFEIQEMSARPDGFELTFTKPVDPEIGRQDRLVQDEDVHLYLSSLVRQPRGGPDDADDHPGEVATDHKSVRLYVTGLQEGHIHDLAAPGVRSAEGQPLLHPQAYYTLNYIPEK